MTINYQDATRLAARIRAKDLSPVEVVGADLDRIDQVNPQLNAIVTLMADSALDAAARAADAVARNEDLGAFHGVPFTIKDSLDTAGVVTQRASRLFAGFIPDTDATAVTRMKAAGGIPLAKTNLPEFSAWWETDNLVTGRTKPVEHRAHVRRLQRRRGGRHLVRDVTGRDRQRRRHLGPRASDVLRHRSAEGHHGRIPYTGTGPAS